MMQRIFWRHAQAAWAANDLERPLTEVGRLQAQVAADWLKDQGIDFPLYTSEARRAQETGRYYAEPKQKQSGLNPDGNIAAVYTALAQIQDETAVIVGHLPWLGKIVGEFLEKPSGYIEVNTAEIFWLEQKDGIWQLKEHFAG